MAQPETCDTDLNRLAAAVSTSLEPGTFTFFHFSCLRGIIDVTGERPDLGHKGLHRHEGQRDSALSLSLGRMSQGE